MVKVVGMWEFGWNTPILEYDIWEAPLREFGVDEWCMCPVSGINRKITEKATIQEFINENSELTLVFLDEKGEIKLSEFEHPKNALYVLGKANFSPLLNFGKGNLSVTIETQSGTGLPWAHQIISIALYDRLKKSWQ